jgi:hypothetical protein
MKSFVPLLIWILSAVSAAACNIPVFRYALERWRPDASEVVVFYQHELTDQQESILSKALPTSPEVKRSAENGPTGELAKVVRVDVGELTEPYRSLWLQVSQGAPKELPYVVVRAKAVRSQTINVWHGTLQSVPDWDVFQSPARTELANRLLAGHSVVWLVVSSNEESRNQQVRQMLEGQLADLAKKIPLPDGIGLPGSELYSEVPLLVKFSVLEVRRDDPRETFLVDLFSKFRPQAFAQGEPLVVPVFGRGRALEVIPASDLRPRLMEDLAAFLSGACSCQVKEQNPGFDLLLSVDWNQELFGEGSLPPPAASMGDRGPPQLLTIPSGR